MFAETLPLSTFGRRGLEKPATYANLRRLLLVLLFIAIYVFIFYDPPSASKARRLLFKCPADHTEHAKKPRARHSIVVDAGSTGTRVHVYEFVYCGDRLHALYNEAFAEVKPGLSSYPDAPLEAAKSLGPLLKAAKKHVPARQRKCAPLILKATAGLRLLPESAVASILGSVREWLGGHPFPLGTGSEDNPKEAVSVMDGSEEGVFAWVTVNFLQKRIGNVTAESLDYNSATSTSPDETAIIMDLGGGSTQIVFSVGSTDSTPPHNPAYYYPLKFGGQTHQLYQQSYLGYGLVEARKAIKSVYINPKLAMRTLSPNIEMPTHIFPCFPKGYSEIVDLNPIESTGKGHRVKLVGNSGGWESCLRLVGAVFKTNAACQEQPCSFNGIHQPHIARSRNLVAFSYFYDRTVRLGMQSPLTLADIKSRGEKICQVSPRSPSLPRLSPVSPQTELEKTVEEEPQLCLDLVYIYSLLHVGYRIEEDHMISVIKKVDGYETGWALGAALKLLDDTATLCPATS